MTPYQRVKIEHRQRETFSVLRKIYGLPPDAYGACVLHAVVGRLAGLAYGVDLRVVSGTAFFRHGLDEYGYQWDLTRQASIDAIKVGALPECHVWCEEYLTNEMVDFSAPYIHKGQVGNKPYTDKPIWLVKNNGEYRTEVVRYQVVKEACRYLEDKILPIFENDLGVHNLVPRAIERACTPPMNASSSL